MPSISDSQEDQKSSEQMIIPILSELAKKINPRITLIIGIALFS